jgi:hypothetical protein
LNADDPTDAILIQRLDMVWQRAEDEQWFNEMGWRQVMRYILVAADECGVFGEQAQYPASLQSGLPLGKLADMLTERIGGVLDDRLRSLVLAGPAEQRSTDDAPLYTPEEEQMRNNLLSGFD